MFVNCNMILGPVASEHSGSILISKETNNAEAVTACQQLNENLLSTTGAHFKSDFTSLLNYLALESHSPLQLFRVASTSSHSCSAIGLGGVILPVSCDAHLPTLCSQQAPYKPNVATDLSTQFQVQVQSKKLTVLGYV